MTIDVFVVDNDDVVYVLYSQVQTAEMDFLLCVCPAIHRTL
jgi:hypothetical protein